MDLFGVIILDCFHNSLKNNKLPPLPRKIRSRISLLALLLMLLATAGYMYVKRTPDKVEARRIESPVLGTPTEVAVTASNRRLTVAWDAIPGATSYTIAVRPKNELVPTWREYTSPSSPYTIKMWAMSGMQYEVRVAAVNARGQSEWSAPVSITVPVLQAAPADAIGGLSSPSVGQLITVGVGSQRPFANRSPWHWFICSADGLDCKVLPRHHALKSYEYFMEHSMGEKYLSVQVDYDKEGVSYSATTELCVVAPVLTTHLYDLQSSWVRLRWEDINGGAIAPLGNDLLVATPHGRFALVRSTGVVYLEENVPMNKAELLAHPDKGNFRLNVFRVADILLKRHSAGRYELFVTHHYFTGECMRFRLSATTLLQQGADVSVSPEWRTILDAEPCLSAAANLIQAGGRMLTDGPDHLLVVIGTHNQNKYAQDPASHLGKLIRVEIETGHTEVLARGLRNPQGLTRDAAGHLWETEHGPQGGDELNVLVAGGNYGWPQVTYGVEYGNKVNVPRAAEVGLHDGFAKPVFAWVPSIGISSVIVNDKHLFPLWKDDLLISSLVGHSFFRVRRDGTDVQYVERTGVGYRIRDLAQMPDRRIALLADRGWVHFLSRSERYADESKCDRSVYAMGCEDHTGETTPDTVGAVPATGAQLYPPSAP